MSLVAEVRLIPTEPALVESRKAAKPWVALNSLILLSRSAELVCCVIAGPGRQTRFEDSGIEYHRQKVLERIDHLFRRAKVVWGEEAGTEAREVEQQVCGLHKSGAKPEVQA